MFKGIGRGFSRRVDVEFGSLSGILGNLTVVHLNCIRARILTQLDKKTSAKGSSGCQRYNRNPGFVTASNSAFPCKRKCFVDIENAARAAVPAVTNKNRVVEKRLHEVRKTLDEGLHGWGIADRQNYIGAEMIDQILCTIPLDVNDGIESSAPKRERHPDC